MAIPTILWADLTIDGSSSELREQFSQHCNVRITNPGSTGSRRTKSGAPNFSVLEYDYPDKRGLSVLRRIKRDHPSVPLIMITLAHSEALAIWAFRAGAWDYLSKPVSAGDIERVCARMQGLIDSKLSDTRRLPALSESPPPVETQYVAKADLDKSIEPAIRYIQTHLAEKINEKHLARLCGMSTFRFSRAFRQCYGMTFRESLLKHRIEASRRLLRNPELTITQDVEPAGLEAVLILIGVCRIRATAFKYSPQSSSPDGCRGAFRNDGRCRA